MITLEAPRSLAGEAKPWQKLGLSQAGLARFLNRARAAAGIEGEVHVLLAGDATLRRLNRQFRGKNEATDVLSFPAGGDAGLGVAGDLAISLETAARQAARFGHSLRDEVRVLLLHGVLHLAGFDHEADAGEMAEREAELRRELGVAEGMIARVAAPMDKQKQNAGILRFAQNDKRNISAQDDGLKHIARDDGHKIVARKGGRA